MGSWARTVQYCALRTYKVPYKARVLARNGDERRGCGASSAMFLLTAVRVVLSTRPRRLQSVYMLY